MCNLVTEPPGVICSVESPGSKSGQISLEVTWEAARHIARAPPISAYRLKLFTIKKEAIGESSLEVRQR